MGDIAHDMRRVFVVDDHAAVAAALSAAIDRTDDLCCIGTISRADAVLGRIEIDQPDVVVMDVNLGDGASGVDLTRAILAVRPATRVVILTALADLDTFEAAAAAGASSFVLKEQDLADVLEALRSSHRRGILIEPCALTRMLDQSRSTVTDAGTASGPLGVLFAPLSGRELEVLSLLHAGDDLKAIARALGMSMNTCRSHLKSAFVKLGAHSQLEAVMIAVKAGLLPPLVRDGR